MLGADAAARGKVHGEWLRSEIADEDLAAIRMYIQQQRALGSPRFQAMVAGMLNRAVVVRPPGRPRKGGRCVRRVGDGVGRFEGIIALPAFSHDEMRARTDDAVS
jgi:hypothetical protein